MSTATVSGYTGAHTEAKERNIPLLVGCRLRFTEPTAEHLLTRNRPSRQAVDFVRLKGNTVL